MEGGPSLLLRWIGVRSTDSKRLDPLSRVIGGSSIIQFRRADVTKGPNHAWYPLVDGWRSVTWMANPEGINGNWDATSPLCGGHPSLVPFLQPIVHSFNVWKAANSGSRRVLTSDSVSIGTDREEHHLAVFFPSTRATRQLHFPPGVGRARGRDRPPFARIHVAWSGATWRSSLTRFNRVACVPKT